ncbi:MAG: DUF721 domain-containing protein [Acidobacteriota bacterium]
MEPISSVLFSLYRNTPHHGDWVLACLEGAWPAIVGGGLAQACRPVSFAESTLTVGIDDPEWQETLLSMREEIAGKVRRATYGEVRRVRFSLHFGGLRCGE